MGFNLNNGTPKNSSLGFGPNLNLNLQGKPDATFVSKPGPLPGLAINKKKNPHSVRGKKIIARNIPGNPLSDAITNPFQGLSSKLTSLSASASSYANHESGASLSASFKFMASDEERTGVINGWEGDRQSSGDHRRVQSKDQVHSEVGQLKGEGSLVLKMGVRESHLVLIPGKGQMTKLMKWTGWYPRKEIKLNPPFDKCLSTVHHLIMKIIIWNNRGALKPNFQSHICDLVQNHDPAIMVIMETKLGGAKAKAITDRLLFDGAIHTETIGYAGGL